ncbi:MAG: outer membrane beta-barrel protein [Gammaproteobacteria bacterium]|nr:outer membrane beta-barrel protein [Gammaproteobacteria bacterium]
MCKLFKLLTVVAGLALISMPAAAYEKGDWIIRGGVGVVDPKSTSYQDETIIVKVDSGTSVVLSATYMFSPNWAFDILAAWPFTHDINVDDPTDAEFSGTVKLGETKHLPPTFSFQYHFMPDANFMPYAGLGLNYTTFFDEEITLDPEASLSLDDSFGLAVQLGADWKLNERWVLNADFRYIDIETEADGAKIDISPLVYSLSFGYIF